jgi:hypothetical protein
MYGTDDDLVYYNAESQAQEEFQVTCTVADMRTDQECAEQWLSRVALESEAVKDAVLHSLGRNEDFCSA